MKDTKREETTAELAAWQQRLKEEAVEEAQLNPQSQSDNQTEKRVKGHSGGGKVKLGK